MNHNLYNLTPNMIDHIWIELASDDPGFVSIIHKQTKTSAKSFMGEKNYNSWNDWSPDGVEDLRETYANFWLLVLVSSGEEIV